MLAATILKLNKFREAARVKVNARLIVCEHKLTDLEMFKRV